MSKWGYVSAEDAKRKFESDPSFACHMVYEMSTLVIKQDKELSDQKDKIMTLQLELMGARSSESHLRGYIDRVKETDPLSKLRELIDKV